MRVDVRLLHDHTADDWHEWVFVGDTERRDAAGRATRKGYRKWLVVRCNNIDCEGRAIVRGDLITDLVEERFPTPPIDRTEGGSGRDI